MMHEAASANTHIMHKRAHTFPTGEPRRSTPSGDMPKPQSASRFWCCAAFTDCPCWASNCYLILGLLQPPACSHWTQSLSVFSIIIAVTLCSRHYTKSNVHTTCPTAHLMPNGTLVYPLCQPYSHARAGHGLPGQIRPVSGVQPVRGMRDVSHRMTHCWRDSRASHDRT